MSCYSCKWQEPYYSYCNFEAMSYAPPLLNHSCAKGDLIQGKVFQCPYHSLNL